MTRFVLVAVGLVVSLATGAQAQQRRLGNEARGAIDRIIDSARVAGLPTGPLSDKVLEGTLKGADDQRIVAAVQSLARELGTARSILGNTNNLSLLGATASALHAGVAAADLRRLARPSGEETIEQGRLTSALIALVDIVAKHVSAATAVTAIGDLLQHGAPERQFTALRSEVEQDIIAGRTPEAALMDRARAHLRTLDANPMSPRPVATPPGPPYLQQ